MDELDELQKCVQAYEELVNKNYILTLENGIKIEVAFKAHHFHHLLGLHYLTDISQVKKTPNQTASAIYRSIRKGHITYSDLQKSAYFHKIEPRITNFPEIHEILNFKIIIDFDPSKVQKTDLNAKYILFKRYDRTYLHLFLAENDSVYYPESFVYEPSTYYINGQNLLDITNVEIVPIENSKKNKVAAR